MASFWPDNESHLAEVPIERGPLEDQRPVLVLDFGGQYAHLIARRVRECRVYSELIAHDTPVGEITAREPLGIILSGGPASVYEPGAPALDPEVLQLGIPVLGICYGMQAMALALGGEVGKTGKAEFGKAPLELAPEAVLFRDLAGRADAAG